MSRKRYVGATREARSVPVDEFCERTGCHRKYAITLLNSPEEDTTLAGVGGKSRSSSGLSS